MEASNQTSTYEYVQVRRNPPRIPPAAEMSEQDKAAWYNYATKWTWRAAECLVELKDFNPSMKWVGRQLNVSIAEAVDAMEGLEQLKLIRRLPNGSFVRTTQEVNLLEVGLEQRDILLGHLALSTEIGARMRDFDHLRCMNFYFSTNRTKLNAALEKINTILRELASDNSVDNDEVFALELSSPSLTKRSPQFQREEVL